MIASLTPSRIETLGGMVRRSITQVKRPKQLRNLARNACLESVLAGDRWRKRRHPREAGSNRASVAGGQNDEVGYESKKTGSPAARSGGLQSGQGRAAAMLTASSGARRGHTRRGARPKDSVGKCDIGMAALLVCVGNAYRARVTCSRLRGPLFPSPQRAPLLWYRCLCKDRKQMAHRN
jgi:hypothetical protein